MKELVNIIKFIGLVFSEAGKSFIDKTYKYLVLGAVVNIYLYLIFRIYGFDYSVNLIIWFITTPIILIYFKRILYNYINDRSRISSWGIYLTGMVFSISFFVIVWLVAKYQFAFFNGDISFGQSVAFYVSSILFFTFMFINAFIIKIKLKEGLSNE